MRFLLIDDEKDLLDVLADIISLTFKDCSIETASSCKEALDLCEKHIYDLITLDFRMPDGNGDVFLEKLHASNNSNAGQPVLILTGYPYEATGLQEKFDTYLAQKPLATEELVKTIRLILAGATSDSA